MPASSAKRKLESAARWLLYATAFTPIIFSGNFLYPFIVPRVVFFRIVIEIILVIFLLLWWMGGIKQEEKLSLCRQYSALALGIYLVVNMVSAFLGESINNSIFGDIERSLGVYTLIHLYLFYIFARTFFNSNSWRIYFNWILGAISIVGMYGIIQYYPNVFGITLFNSGPGRILSTLGNPAYAAMILIFGIFTAVFLGLEFKNSKLKYLYFAVALVLLFAFSLTDVRGAYLGLIAGIGVFFTAYAATGASRRVKALFLSLLVVGAISAGVLFTHRDRDFVKSLPILGKLAEINLQQPTIITRFIGWKAAWKGFLDRPILGTGPENFYIAFNQHFDPIFYTYAGTEPFFDRAHNHYLDLLATTGVFGFLAYVSIVASIVYYLRGLRKKRRISLSQLAALSSLFVAYFAHLFFVFDDINSLFLFFAIIGFVEYKFYRNPLLEFSEAKTDSRKPRRAALACIIGALVLWAGFNFNVKILSASKNILTATLYQSAGDAQLAAKHYQAGSEFSAIPRKGIVDKYVNFLAALANQYHAIPNEAVKALFEKNSLILEKILKEEARKNPLDPVTYSKLAAVYTARYVVYKQDADKDLSLAYVKKAIEVGPNRPQYYNLLAESYILFGEPKKALEAVNASLALNPDYTETYAYRISVYLALDEVEKAYDLYEEMFDNSKFFRGNNVPARLGKRLIDQGEVEKAEHVYNLWVLSHSNDSRIITNLVIVSLLLDKPEKAIEYAKKAAEINPVLETEVQYIIEQIQKNNIDELLKQLQN